MKQGTNTKAIDTIKQDKQDGRNNEIQSGPPFNVLQIETRIIEDCFNEC